MFKKTTHQELLIRQQKKSLEQKVSIILLLDNVRSLFNVGSMFRTADAMGIEKVFLCGITGYPPQSGITKSALGSEESVVWEYHKDSCQVIQTLRNKGFKVVILEQAQESICYDEYIPKKEERIVLVVGNEITGISDDVMKLADQVIEIPMYGVKNSLNVSVACGIVLCYLSCKLRRIYS